MSVVSHGVSDDLTGLDELIEQMRQDGHEWAMARAEYYRAKGLKSLELKASGMPVTLIHDVVRSYDDVNRALMRKDAAEVNYHTSKEAVMARKMQVRTRNQVATSEYWQ